MLDYNTSQRPLVMSQYGRHIQEMIDYCCNIEDREERTNCAIEIAGLMSRIFDNGNKSPENQKKIWDHINIISGFSLDIDFPVEVAAKEELNPRPKKIPYQQSISRFRHYGRNIQEMLDYVSAMEGGDEKDALIFLIANQMKKQLISHNPEIATDIRVYNDIREMTRGRININPENYRLNDYVGLMPLDNKKKKKK